MVELNKTPFEAIANNINKVTEGLIMYKMYYDDLITEIETIHFKDGVYIISAHISEHVPYEAPQSLYTVKLTTSNIEDWNSKDWRIKRLLDHGVELI